MPLVEGFFLVIPSPPCGRPRLGCLLAWTFVLALYFYFFLGALFL
jgi:hypothetical protein